MLLLFLLTSRRTLLLLLLLFTNVLVQVAGASAYYYASAISALEDRRRESDKAEMSLQLKTLSTPSSSQQQQQTTPLSSEPSTPTQNKHHHHGSSSARKRKPFSRLGSGGGSGSKTGGYNDSSSSSSSDEEDSKKHADESNRKEAKSRAPPPSPQQFNSRLASRLAKNESDLRILRSNSALEHKVVFNDVTDTETEDQSFKDNDDSMLQDDMLLSEQERRKDLEENQLAINSDSSSSSSSRGRGGGEEDEREDNVKKDNAGNVLQKKNKKDALGRDSYAESSDGNSDAHSTRVTIRTAKVGTPNVPIMIKDSKKDGSVHGGKIKVGELAKLRDITGSYTKVLSPRRASMSDTRNYFGSSDNVASEASSPTTAGSAEKSDALDAVGQQQQQNAGTPPSQRIEIFAQSKSPLSVDMKPQSSATSSILNIDDASAGPSTTPSYKNMRMRTQQLREGTAPPSPFGYDTVTLRESSEGQTITDECEETCLMIEYCIGLREKYLFEPTLSKVGSPVMGSVEIESKEALAALKTDQKFKMVDGVVRVFSKDDELLHEPPASATAFFHDLHALMIIQSAGPAKSFCHKRLMLTEQKFSLHVMLNSDAEFLAQKRAPHRDFYNVRKVDTHVHHSACMNQKHLLRFIKSKLKKEPNELVIYRDGKYLNLKEVFESIGMTSHELNIDTLDMRADKNTFHRFDRFNLKYNPCGQSRLREIFIKSDNLIRGRFLAELTKEVLTDLEANKYTMAEYRLSIYGRRKAEWDSLAAWVLNHGLFSKNIVWMIQLPRLFNIYKAQGTMKNFQQMLDNIFIPLFEVTIDPSSHPELHHFLKTVVGFDMVDDESKPERRPNKHMRVPEDWNVNHNPAYSYYAYYVYANLYTLNKLRESKGMNIITFRPHAGEAGDIDHLATTFMLAENIAHGINLRKSPVLQYLYYLTQIGLNMSPLSNNSLFVDYHRNPFPLFFARGLAVTLSTDDPLQIHMTKEPLVEEYSVAAQVWKLSAADLCEIARNSVLNSGFPREAKKHWISDNIFKSSSSNGLASSNEGGGGGGGEDEELVLHALEANDIEKTNVPDLRVQFRYDVLEAEKGLVRRACAQAREKGRVVKVR